jgi:hypothetical protein
LSVEPHFYAFSASLLICSVLWLSWFFNRLISRSLIIFRYSTSLNFRVNVSISVYSLRDVVIWFLSSYLIRLTNSFSIPYSFSGLLMRGVFTNNLSTDRQFFNLFWLEPAFVVVSDSFDCYLTTCIAVSQVFNPCFLVCLDLALFCSAPCMFDSRQRKPEYSTDILLAFTCDRSVVILLLLCSQYYELFQVTILWNPKD